MARIQANPMNVISFVAGETMTAKQYRAVALAVGANAKTITTIVSAAEGAHIVGVLQNKPADGVEAAVATGGTSRLEMAATCQAGEKIMADGDGKGTPATPDTYAIIGIALSANTLGNGGFIEVLIVPGGVVQADESD